MRFLLLLVFVLATCWASDPIFDDIEPRPFNVIPTGYRLPTNVVPDNYKIVLTPYINVPDKDKNFTFDGQSEISIKIMVDQTKSITLHAKELIIEIEKLECKSSESNDDIPDIKTSGKLDEVKEFYEIGLNKPLPSGAKCILKLNYKGQLNDKLRGFYRSSFQDEDGHTNWLATTHFEPTGARMAFPCWDEPALKATFEISIKHPPEYNVISNMAEIKKDQQNDDTSVTSFKKTPLMSTYLVAFVVASNYKNLTKDNGDFNVWTRSNAIDSAKYSLEHGYLVLKELGNYTDFDYKKQGMSKMDQISIPDFEAGAMENWGLVTYRESHLLCVKNVTTTQNKQNIATVISHEFAHQWFGNLVTPKWWKYIWLNEGFANFFQYYITDRVFDEEEREAWRLMEQFVIKNLQESAFVTDASVKTRPMNQDAATPDQIQSLFDNIAYKKAGSVIRMMQHIVTEKTFQKGLQSYLKKYQFKSVDSENLFDEINTALGNSEDKVKLPEKKQFKDIMKNWVEQPGYPVINVKRENTTAELNQKRFFLIKPSKQDTTQWYVPINYITENSSEVENTTVTHWLEPDRNLTIDALKDSKEWIIVNKLQTGYYRVNYDIANWERLAKYLDKENNTNINSVTRSQLIDDSLNLARAGELPYETALKITLYLSKETDYIPWYTAVRAFDFLDRVLYNSENYAVFQKYVAQKLQSFVRSVNITDELYGNETHILKLSKQLALTAGSKYGVQEMTTFAQIKLHLWLTESQELDADLESGILCGGLQNADNNTWYQVLEKYKESNKTKKAIFLKALGCVKSEEIVKEFLRLSINKDFGLNMFDVLNSINEGNTNSADIIIEFLKIYRNEFSKNNEELISFLNQFALRITNMKQYGELSIFVYRHELHLDEKFEALIKARDNIDWVELYAGTVTKWIVENYKGDDNDGDSATCVSLTSLLILVPVLLTRFY